MGNWNMTVTGIGAHHNTEYDKDADKMFKEFVTKLEEAGHNINHASFTYGGAEFVTPKAKLKRNATKPLHKGEN